MSEELNLKQDEFCKAYISKDFFGNGTQAYLEAYGLKDEEDKHTITYDTARVNASRLLTNANILKRINSLLEEGGFNEQNVDKQHLFLINQHADLKTKMNAIKEYNRMKERGAEVHKFDFTDLIRQKKLE